MRTYSTFCLAALMVAGCSWQNTIHTVSQAPQHVRLSERIWIDSDLRWRLPAATTIVAVDEGLAPQNWIVAANAGLNSVFDQPLSQRRSQKSSQQNYRLVVHWPNLAASTEEGTRGSFGATLRDFITLPRTAAAQVVTVKLFDQAEHFVATMDVHISPPLLGPDWHDERMIQDSFRQLARSLRDG